MPNKREQERIDCDIILNKIEGGITNICRAENISLGGMKLKRLLEPNEESSRQVRLQFELPGEEEPLWVGAEMIYESSDETFGVRFTHISHQHFVKLRDWLRATPETDAA